MARRITPDDIPKFSDIVRGENQNVVGAFTALEGFLYSLAYGMVQGQDAIQSPTLARGDMIVKEINDPGSPDSRLPIGDDGEFLGVTDGLPDWQPVPNPLADVTTPAGLQVQDIDVRRLLELIWVELLDIEKLLAR